MQFVIAPLQEYPDLESVLWSKELQRGWPRFMLQDPTASLVFGPGQFERFHAHVLVVFDPEAPGKVLARALSVPFCIGASVGRPELPHSGWDAVVRWADQDHTLGRTPNAVAALEILVHPHHRSRGLSQKLVEALRENTARLGFGDLYAPVRPSGKLLEPRTPMREYAARVREDGLPADAWLRVHIRAGGRITSIAPCSMTIPGTLADWRSWTGLPFDKSGEVLVPGALVPVHASVEHDHAVYAEPNVWVHHRVRPALILR
jgi:GNAT superfamily N-acetyltransferase